MKAAIVHGSIVALLIALLGACAEEAPPASAEGGAHPAAWADPAAHGRLVLEGANKAEDCATCHGEDYQGGTSGVSCMAGGCHATQYPHPEGFTGAQGGLHRAYIVEHENWDLTACQACHGTDYAGAGFEEKDCTTCHRQEGGPEACNTCHGGDHNGAPPQDLLGRTDPTFASVGAHQAHVGPAAQTSVVRCTDCHANTTSYDAPGHLDAADGPRGEVVFSALATQNGRLAPVYDPATGTCANVYCHGAFSFEKASADRRRQWAYTGEAITGTPTVPLWTAVGTGVACGTCHGLPPADHRQSDDRVPIMEQCETCHQSVRPDRSLDPAFHIDGKIQTVLEGVTRARLALEAAR